jgi:cell pole-organizing protein PopZ
MSGVNGHGSPAGGLGPAGTPETDPSMEDILASIRRILSEDESPAEAPAAAVEPAFNLDESMLVAAPKHAAGKKVQAAQIAQPAPQLSTPAPEISARESMAPLLTPKLAEPATNSEAPMTSGNGDARGLNGLNGHAAADPVPHGGAPMGPLVAPAATDAVTASMGALMRSLAVERQVYRGGPTLEDMVRDEMRPMLKEWLDTNLPPLVERIVRAEIERVAQRAGG